MLTSDKYSISSNVQFLSCLSHTRSNLRFHVWIQHSIIQSYSIYHMLSLNQAYTTHSLWGARSQSICKDHLFLKKKSMLTTAATTPEVALLGTSSASRPLHHCHCELHCYCCYANGQTLDWCTRYSFAVHRLGFLMCPFTGFKQHFLFPCMLQTRQINQKQLDRSDAIPVKET